MSQVDCGACPRSCGCDNACMKIGVADPKVATCGPGSECSYVSTHRGHHIYKASGPGPFVFGGLNVTAPADLASNLSAGLFYCDGRWFNTAWSAVVTIDEQLSP